MIYICVCFHLLLLSTFFVVSKSEIDKNGQLYELLNVGVTTRIWDKIKSTDLQHLLSPKCAESLKFVKDGIASGDPNSYKFVDASSKAIPGLLMGTVSSFGDYDECLDISGSKMSGMYCMAMLQLDKVNINRDEASSELMARIPPMKFFDPLIGICLPSDCNRNDVAAIVRKGISRHPLTLRNVTHCDTKESIQIDYRKLTIEQNLSIIFVGTFLVLTAIGSCAHLIFDLNVLRPFSLLQNYKNLVTVDLKDNRSNEADIFKLVMALVAASMHSIIAGATENSLYTMSRLHGIEEAARIWWLQPAMNSHMIVLASYASGILLSSGLLPLAMKDSGFSYISRTVQRVVKMAPGLLCLIALEFVWPLTGSGPLFSWEAANVVHDCQNTWWQVLLFTVNFNAPTDNCAGHTYYSSVDMQLFILGLIAIYLTVKSKKFGIFFSLTMIAYDFAMTAHMSHTYDTGVNLVSCPLETTKFIRYLHRIHFQTFYYLGAYFSGYLAGLFLNSGKNVNLGNVTQYSCIFLLLSVLPSAPALYNSFDNLVPQWTTSYFMVLYKIVLLVTATAVVISSTMVNRKYSRAKRMSTVNNNENEEKGNSIKEKTTNYFVAALRLSTAIYLTNYLFVRWDFFTNRSLFENRPYAFIRRSAYTIVFCFILGFVFQLIFLAPIEHFRKYLFRANDSKNASKSAAKSKKET